MWDKVYDQLFGYIHEFENEIGEKEYIGDNTTLSPIFNNAMKIAVKA